MAPCKHILAATILLVGGNVTAQQSPSSSVPAIAIDVPAFGAYVGSNIPLTVRSLSARLASDSVARTAIWESSDPTKAWVTSDGTAILLRPGKVTLSARLGALSASRTLDVRESGAHSLALDAGPVMLRVGEGSRISVTARDAKGQPIGDARANVGVVGQDASIDSGGYFSARRPGTYLVVAELGGVSATRQIDVISTGIFQQGGARSVNELEIHGLERAPYVGSTVTLQLNDGRGPEAIGATWSVSDTTVARVSSHGALTLIRAGDVEVSATEAGHRTTRKIHVQPNPVAEMTLRVGDDVRVGDRVRVTVDAWARGGRRVTDAPVTYAIASSPRAAGNASISETGEFVARSPGVYTIIAAVNGMADRQTMLVREKR